jgi:hypothetical protein
MIVARAGLQREVSEDGRETGTPRRPPVEQPRTMAPGAVRATAPYAAGATVAVWAERGRSAVRAPAPLRRRCDCGSLG